MDNNSESLTIYTIQHEIVADKSFNYIAVSPNGQLAATFNSKTFTINFYEIENLATPTVISCDEIGKFDSTSKVSYSLAISNPVRIRGKHDALIAVSCFCDKDMIKEMNMDDCSTTDQDITDIEKGDDLKKSATFVISMNLKTRIETIVDTGGGVVKFLESTNLIVINASGITKAFINHDDSNVINVIKEYEFPINIQDKIDNLYQDIPCTELLQNSIVSNYLFVEDYRNKNVEMYNLKSLDLEIVFEKHDKTPYSTSLLKNPIFCISNHGHLLAHCSSAKNITIYLMENGLETVTKEFNNANKILLVSFIDDDEKLFIVTEEENGLMINIWDIFTYKSDIRTRKIDNTNILNSFQEANNYHSVAISRGTILASLQNGTVFSVLDHSDVKHILKPFNELINLHSIDIKKAQQNNSLESYSEPWVNYKQYNYISTYLGESETIQLIIGRTTVQVWRKRNHGSKAKQVLEYIWANLSNEIIEVISLKVGNQEFSLDLSLSSAISADKSQNIVKIHWPNETHILKDACDTIKYLYERKYEVRQENQEKYEKLVTETEKIIKKCIKKNPDLWRLSEIRYELMTNLIQAKHILLLYQILFNCKKVIANNKTCTKVSRYLHIPRQHSWPVKEKKSDLEIAIEKSSDKEKVIVDMLLEYYSNNAEKNIGWMFTVTKAIPSLLNKHHLECCLKELFYKPCFGAKEEYLNSKFVSKFISQDEMKKGYNKKIYPLSIKPQLLEKQNSSWWNVENIMKNIKYKLSKIDRDAHHATTVLRIVPLPDFTLYPANAIKPRNNSILLKLFKSIVWPKNYLNLSHGQRSPFLKFLDDENILSLYDNPAIEACIEFKWKTSKNHFLWHLLKFVIFSAIFIVYFNYFRSSYFYMYIIIYISFFYLGCHILVTEIAQFINEGKKYLNIYNIFDIASVIIPIITVILQLINDYAYYYSNTVKYLQGVRWLNISASFAYLVLSFEFLLLLRMSSRIANYINIVLNILKAVLPFMGFMLFLTFSFGTTMFSLLAIPYLNHYDNGDVSLENSTNSTTFEQFDLSDPVTTFIDWSIGKWNGLNPLDFWPIFLLSMFASIMLAIIMQNLLIAVMTNIYENAKSNARLVALKCRGELIADFEKTEKLIPRKESGNQRYIYYIGNSDYQEEWLERAKKFRESHRSLFVDDISNQLLLAENNSSSDDESDDDDDDDSYDKKSNNESTTTINVKNENYSNVKEDSDSRRNIDEKFLKLQEEMKKMQNNVAERLNFVEERFNFVEGSLKEILSLVKKSA